MDDMATTKQTALRWDLSERRIAELCPAGCIPGTKRQAVSGRFQKTHRNPPVLKSCAVLSSLRQTAPCFSVCALFLRVIGIVKIQIRES